MNRFGLIAAMLAVAAALACGAASAQPHTEPEVDFKTIVPVTEPGQVTDWLQRLNGRFKYDGMVQMGDCAPAPSAGGGPPPPPSDDCQGIKGVSDCVKVGDGPGVQCILNVTWQDIYRVNFEDGTVTEVLASYLDPAMELYGLDPGKLKINHMMVNNKGIGESGWGTIKGNTAVFRAPCVNTAVSSTAERCYRIVRIEAKPDSNLVWMWFGFQNEPSAESTFAVMTLHRANPGEEAAPILKPVSQRRRK